MADALKEAVERVTRDATVFEDKINAVEVCVILETPPRVRYLGDTAADLRTILAALSAETERAEILQQAVHDRCGERDAALERERVKDEALSRIVPHTKYPTAGTLYDARARLEHIRFVSETALSPETTHEA
jgi:hypothetical protein